MTTLDDQRQPVRISVEKPASNAQTIDLGRYHQPDVSVDGGTKFSTHDIIGGPTVRQKTGEEPRTMNINGVCIEEAAKKIQRLPRSSLFSVKSSIATFDFAQLQSFSTQPMDEGGAMDLEGEFLYEYQLTFIEVATRQS